MSKPDRPKFLIVTVHYLDELTPEETFYMVEDLTTTEDNILEMRRRGYIIGHADLALVAYVEVQADG